MGAILRVRDTNGNIIEFPALQGPPGRGISSITTDGNEFVITYTDNTTARAAVPSSGAQPTSINISLLATGWVGSEAPYSQIVEISGVTTNSQIDLRPTPAQVKQLQTDETTLLAANDNGVVTIYALGYKPTVNYEMQATITEVV